MRAEHAQRVEAGVGIAATGALAAAIGFAVSHAVDGVTDLAGMVAAGGFAAVFAYPAAAALRRRLEGGPAPFPQASFDIAKIEPVVDRGLGELLLTDKFPPAAKQEEPLELSDVLADIGADSRVVQLFDPSAMPTPGQLKARIDRHLDGGTSSPPDASEALFEALADLRRSLR